MNLKCLFGFHKWKKWGGWCHIPNDPYGRFSQRLICEKCKKMKNVIR